MNEPTTFGIKDVQHRLTSEKLDRIEKEIRAIEKTTQESSVKAAS